MMGGRDWEAELKKIDHAMAATPDAAVSPAPPAAGKGAAAPPATRRAEVPGSRLGLLVRLSLALALGVALAFWPYSARCGVGTITYLGAVTTLAAAGAWSAISAWRRRAPRSHVLSLAIVLWALGLAAADVLPRIGYAKPGPERPARWTCG